MNQSLLSTGLINYNDTQYFYVVQNYAHNIPHKKLTVSCYSFQMNRISYITSDDQCYKSVFYIKNITTTSKNILVNFRTKKDGYIYFGIEGNKLFEESQKMYGDHLKKRILWKSQLNRSFSNVTLKITYFNTDIFTIYY